MKISARVRNSLGQHEATVATNETSHAIVIPPKASGLGSSVNGGELLFLALATCYCNDMYREAAKRGIAVSQVEVEVEGEFGAAGEPARAGDLPRAGGGRRRRSSDPGPDAADGRAGRDPEHPARADDGHPGADGGGCCPGNAVAATRVTPRNEGSSLRARTYAESRIPRQLGIDSSSPRCSAGGERIHAGWRGHGHHRAGWRDRRRPP